MGSTRVHLTQHCLTTQTTTQLLQKERKCKERCKEERERGRVTEKSVGKGKRNREREKDVLLKVASSLPTCPHFK